MNTFSCKQRSTEEETFCSYLQKYYNIQMGHIRNLIYSTGQDLVYDSSVLYAAMQIPTERYMIVPKSSIGDIKKTKSLGIIYGNAI